MTWLCARNVMMSVYIEMVVRIGRDHALRCHISLHVNVVQCTMQAYSFETWKLVANRSPILKGPNNFFYSALPGQSI